MSCLGQMRDGEFKRFMSKRFGASHRLGFGCDFEWAKDSVLYLIEHENSSRGLACNLIRILKRIDESGGDFLFRLLLLRTDLHMDRHENDFRMASFVASLRNENTRLAILPANEFGNIDVEMLVGLNWDALDKTYVRRH